MDGRLPGLFVLDGATNKESKIVKLLKFNYHSCGHVSACMVNEALHKYMYNLISQVLQQVQRDALISQTVP